MTIVELREFATEHRLRGHSRYRTKDYISSRKLLANSSSSTPSELGTNETLSPPGQPLQGCLPDLGANETSSISDETNSCSTTSNLETNENQLQL